MLHGDQVGRERALLPALAPWDGGTTWQLPSQAGYADRDDWDLNDRDQVAWEEPLTGRLLLWEEGTPQELARSGAASVRINALGQVVWREWNGVAGEIFLSVPLDSAPPGD